MFKKIKTKIKDYISLQQENLALKKIENINNKKKILLISHQLTTTGSPLMLFYLAKELIKKGYYPVVLSYGGGSLVKSFHDINVPVICGEIYNRNSNVMKNLAEKFDSVIVNSIVCHHSVEVVPNAIWLVHEGQNVEKVFIPDYPTLKNTLQSAKIIFAVSDYAKETIEKFNQNVQIIKLGIEDKFKDYPDVSNTNEKIKFALVGNVCECKAQDILAEAILKLDEDCLNKCEFHFICAKKGRRYRKLSAQLSKLNNVFFDGLIDNQNEKWQKFSQMDTFIIPSRDESLSLIVLEACMLKKTVIVSENVGAKYMVENGKNGYIVPTENSTALKNAIQKIINQKEELPEMGELSRKMYKENASFEVFIDSVKKIAGLIN